MLHSMAAARNIPQKNFHAIFLFMTMHLGKELEETVNQSEHVSLPFRSNAQDDRVR